ncbi:MAG: aminotransferase yhxA [Solibacillus sp.]
MEKTKKVMVGISAAAALLAGCGTSTTNLPAKPTDESCRNWEWSEEDGVWQCDESRSSHYGAYYYAGRYFQSKSALQSNRDYASYKAKASSGFGTGSKSYGG